jgi:hypothetical protein
MKKTVFLLITGLNIMCSSGFAQDILWKAGVHSFFDNTEFGHSAVQMPQTMAGVHLAPEFGLSWDNKHRIYAGVDVLHEYGSNKTVDYYDPIVYYEYNSQPFRFYMGAIPRQLVLDKYPRMFFQDSIRNYRPVINGLFWEYRQEGNYANVWLDWASRQTYQRHESFFMGWSGRYNWKMLYAQHFGYMFHFAGVMDPVVPEAVHDNGLLLTSLGIDLAQTTGWDKLEANIGWSLGMDRDRDIAVWNKPKGFLSEIKAEYRGLGIFNTYYKGDSQQVFYADHSNQLYWGDPIYRSKEYDRLDGYILFLKTASVEVKLTYSLHFTEQKMYHEQMLNVTCDLDNLKSKRHEKKYRFLWDNWF